MKKHFIFFLSLALFFCKIDQEDYAPRRAKLPNENHHRKLSYIKRAKEFQNRESERF